MTNVRDIAKGHADALERELDRIRRFYNESLEENETLEIQWGTKESFQR